MTEKNLADCSAVVECDPPRTGLEEPTHPSIIRHWRYFGLTIAISLAACRSAAPSPSKAPATPTLIPPVASEPAAGICAGPDSSQAPRVEVNVDIPDPRCLRVLPDQSLIVVNRTDVEILVRLGPYEIRIAPGAEGPLPAPFGSYLAPGVHVVEAEPYAGPELVLAESW